MQTTIFREKHYKSIFQGPKRVMLKKHMCSIWSQLSRSLGAHFWGQGNDNHAELGSK